MRFGERTFFFPEAKVWWPPTRSSEGFASIAVLPSSPTLKRPDCRTDPDMSIEPTVLLSNGSELARSYKKLLDELSGTELLSQDHRTGEIYGLGLLELGSLSPFEDSFFFKGENVSATSIPTLISCYSIQQVPVPTCRHLTWIGDVTVEASYKRSCLSSWKDVNVDLIATLKAAELPPRQAAAVAKEII